MRNLRRAELALGIACLFVAIAGIAAAQLDFDGWMALLSLLAILMLGFGAIPFNDYLDNRDDRKDAERRNHVRRP